MEHLEGLEMTVENKKERRDVYRRLFENSRDAIYITSKSGKFIDVNPAFLNLFGYARNELKQMNALRLYIDQYKRKFFISEMERNKFVNDFEVKLRRSNGKIIDCIISADARTSKDGFIIGYQGIIHDVTDKIIAENTAKRG